jgi:hypothetical protein
MHVNPYLHVYYYYYYRSVVLSIMSLARVICYRGQELAAALISHFSLINEHG